nr:uncharacterized protein LOC129260797 [Lytechinus pictus]
MEEQSAIGLVLKGSRLGRKGKLSLVLVLCDEQVYMFDVLAIPSLFTRKFIDILQSYDITKVIHDCRFVSDLLYHHYGIQLNSVFDTQVGDILIKKRQYMGDFPRHVSGTTQCILEYLEISIHDIAMHLEQTQRIAENESSWFERPLSKGNIRCALLDTVYLLRLREAITEQLMAEVTCAIDIYLTVERDRLEVDPKKTSSNAPYVPRELINDLHRRVAQVGMINKRVKPKEPSFPHRPRSSTSQDTIHSPPKVHSPPKGPSGRGVYLDKGGQDTTYRGYQKTSPGRTAAKPLGHEPPRPPLMMGMSETEEDKEDIEEVSSVSSEDSDDAFADCNEKELWQQRYSKNVKPVTLREALSAKEKHEDMVPGYHDETQSTNDHQSPGHQQPKDSSATLTVPSRTDHNNTSVSITSDASGTGETNLKSSSEDKLRSTIGGSRTADLSDHSYSHPGSTASLKLTDLRQSDASQRQRSKVPKTSSNRQPGDVIQRKPSSETGKISGQVSYADALAGKKKDEELKMKAKRTLKAIGKALAAGEIFSDDTDDSKDKDNDVDPHNGYSGHSSYEQGYSGYSSRNKHVPSKGILDQCSSPSTGRGRASLVNHQTQVLNARQSQHQSRTPGGLGMRGQGRTFQVDFPTAEDMESAPDSVPVPVGSTFLSQRAI